jgi:Ni/Co efflux regulator RcnB
MITRRNLLSTAVGFAAVAAPAALTALPAAAVEGDPQLRRRRRDRRRDKKERRRERRRDRQRRRN